MKLNDLVSTYTNWQDYEDEPTEEIISALDSLEESQNDDTNAFFQRIIDDFSEEKDAFWVMKAIDYMHHAKDKKFARDNLEKVITDYLKFGVLGAGLGKAASYLGIIAEYPNSALKHAIERMIRTDDTSEILAHRLFRASAYGAYIMTATDFQTGLEAGRMMKDSAGTPTVKAAEQVIAQWRKGHGQ